MEAISGWDDGEVRLVFEELEAEDYSTVASADDNDVLIRGKRGTGPTHLLQVKNKNIYFQLFSSEI